MTGKNVTRTLHVKIELIRGLWGSDNAQNN
uniref:Uncharacterized protein n=1 Tax=Anguilla anguilla TaxID=7936 RepID=A0A0E9W9S3_ANGAN